MPNGQAFDDAVKIAAHTPGLGVGIHLSLVGEECVAPQASLGGLVDAGGRLPESHIDFVKQYALGRFGVREITAEIEAQIARVLVTGIKPTHIDSHQHLHMLPALLGIVVDAARTNGIPVVRVPMETASFGGRRAQKCVLSMLCRRAIPRLMNAGLRHADHFFGFTVSGRMDESNLSQTIDRLRPGVNEIMCHPGFSDTATQNRYQWGYRWEDEQSGLVSESVTRSVEEGKIRLANFGDAWNEPLSGIG